ncbi:MAG: response regulator transcription factor [Actinobacteria bacterium]|nr:response regulator transcription factor [Actinomycetota bacterium]
MLVDDHVMVAHSLGRVLELEDDIDVIATANSVGQGIAAAATHRPDVILMDYRLPDGDGISAAARIKTDDPDARIVLLAGSDDPDALRRAVDAGFIGYIDKARSIDELVAAVRIAATGHVAISANDLTKLAAGPRTDPTRLTKREREILFLVAEGLSNKAIAGRLVRSVHTVRTHAQTILAKLGADSKLEAIAIAKRRKLLG